MLKVLNEGTEAVVRDIDYLSRLIEGEDKPINCECHAVPLLVTC
jgi:hypothetical protein